MALNQPFTTQAPVAAVFNFTDFESGVGYVTYQGYNSEDDSDKKKAKNLLKKLMKIKLGQQKQKMIIEDPSGNSAIISDKAEKSSLKVK